MKKFLFPVLVIIGFSCSTPKNYYSFNNKPFQYDKPAEKVMTQPVEVVNEKPVELTAEESPLVLSDKQLEATMSVAENTTDNSKEPMVFSRETYKAASKAEKKVMRKALKKELKSYIKEAKARARGEKVEATHDIVVTGYTRIGIILGAAGIVLMILTTGTVSQLGSLLLLIGVIFILVDLL